jgi:16S rRNA (cytosine967-C5)-methyltransferase
MSEILTSRQLALDALGDRAGNVTAHLDRLLGRAASPAEASLAWELALGVVRRRGTLDAVVKAFQKKPEMPAPRLLNSLRLGLYQLLFLDRIPDFAAVNETVELCPPETRGFVNGMLRSVQRSVSAVQHGQAASARDVLETEPGQFRRFDRPIFANPSERPAAYLAEACSLPEELAYRWFKAFGGLAKVLAVARHANARPPLVLRVDTELIGVQTVLGQLAALGVPAVAHANGYSVVVSGPLELEKLPAFGQGHAHPQDAMASSVIAACGDFLKPGMAALDLCAAPGTKTVQIARRLAGQGRIVAADVNPEKLARVQDNCRRCGIQIVQTVQAQELAGLEPESFDFVLVDAPCTNTGVLARRAEARWRFSRRSLEQAAFNQRQLVFLGANFVRPGGTLVYSTCSLEREENSGIIEDLISRRRDLRLLHSRGALPAGVQAPQAWSDGGFYAIIEKRKPR